MVGPNAKGGSALEVADVPSPIGTFRILYEGSTVRSVDLLERGLDPSEPPQGARRRRAPFPPKSPPAQLAGYFRGGNLGFDLSVEALEGGAFDRKVWAALRSVPPGATITYGALARKAGYAGAARAVGGAMRRNPVPIIVPCHRVVGSEGSLTGFGLGLWRKRWLLDREGAWPIRARSLEGPPPASGQRTLDEIGGSARPVGRASPRSSSRRTARA